MTRALVSATTFASTATNGRTPSPIAGRCAATVGVIRARASNPRGQRVISSPEHAAAPFVLGQDVRGPVLRVTPPKRDPERTGSREGPAAAGRRRREGCLNQAVWVGRQGACGLTRSWSQAGRRLVSRR